jgi:2-polyprenyl-6-methoxyphenol hydroxylase-like FAD-dependent oxidoreductase
MQRAGDGAPTVQHDPHGAAANERLRNAKIGAAIRDLNWSDLRVAGPGIDRRRRGNADFFKDARAMSTVIVVGAGPVGLLTALGLARQDIDVTILDAEPGIIRSPRAAVYFHTTLNVLARLGLLEEAEAIGLKNAEFCMHFRATGEFIRANLADLSEPGQKYPYQLHFGQHLLADLVMRHLARLPGTRVLWNHRLTGLAQDAHHVSLQIETPSGATRMTADWVVGADGARSTVRQLLDLGFDGHTWPDRFVATNIEYDFSRYGYADANAVVDPVNWAVVARLGRENLWRVTYGEDANLDERTILERLPARFAAILPAPEPYRIDNFSPYRVHERCAARFRVGRVLLAGDAAHACNPCGGLGLTGGVIDADALSSVLAAVIRGRAGEAALDFYAQERRRVFLEVTSPLASDFKRQFMEPDPRRVAADRQAFIDSIHHTGPAVRAGSLSKLLLGRPMPV